MDLMWVTRSFFELTVHLLTKLYLHPIAPWSCFSQSTPAEVAEGQELTDAVLVLCSHTALMARDPHQAADHGTSSIF